MAITLDNLPDEILVQILGYLNATDVPRVSLVNKRLKAISDDPSFWINAASRDYNVSLKSSYSPKDIYQKLLHKFRGVLGLWQRKNLEYFSQLIRVFYSHEDSTIVFQHLVAPRSVNDDVIQDTFAVFGLDDQLGKVWMKQTGFPHSIHPFSEYPFSCLLSGKEDGRLFCVKEDLQLVWGQPTPTPRKF